MNTKLSFAISMFLAAMVTFGAAFTMPKVGEGTDIEALQVATLGIISTICFVGSVILSAIYVDEKEAQCDQQ